MRKTFVVVLGALGIAILGGCSGSGGGSGGGGGGLPQTQGEALAKLSASQQQAFDGWKQGVVKSCDPSNIFGLKQRNRLDDDGIDGALLLQKNSGSAMFQSSDGFVVLTGAGSFSGVGNSKVEESQEVNGQISSIKAETRREGSHCSVYLFDQKVYEVDLATHFVVGAQWSNGKTASASVASLPQIRPLGPSNMGEVDLSPAWNALSQAMEPSQEALKLLAQKLNLSSEQATKFFKLNTGGFPTSVVRTTASDFAPWSSRGDQLLVAPLASLKQILDGTPRTLPLNVRLLAPSLSFGAAKNSVDRGNWDFAVEVSINPNGNAFVYAIRTLAFEGLKPFNQDEALTCARDRFNALFGRAMTNQEIRPTVAEMFDACRVLHPEVRTAAEENGLLKSLIPIAFANIVPSPMNRYGQWDDVLSKLALNALAQKKDLRAELDPSSRTKIVDLLASHLDMLQMSLDRYPAMKSVQDGVLGLGLHWAFAGRVVSANRVEQIMNSLNRAADVFPVSVSLVLEPLRINPDSSNEFLAFAISINDAYKAEARKALRLSQDLNYSLFQREIFNQVLQHKTSIEDLKDWSSKFDTIKTSMSRYANLAPVKGELTSASIFWLRNGTASPQDIDGVYSAIDHSVVPFLDSSESLINTLVRTQGPAANREALDFARSLTPEYKQLAVAVRDRAKTMDFENWGNSFFANVLQNRPSLEQVRGWNATLIAGEAFTQRERARVKDDFGSTNEWDRKSILETALKETWSDAEFTGLEAIAELATAQPICQRHHGASARANCAGQTLFSKNSKMFFDPAFGARYVELSRDFKAYMQQLGDGAMTFSLRSSLLNAFFNSTPLWANCGGEVFAQKATSLKSQMKAWAAESNTLKKWEIERQIKDALNQCR